MAIPGPGPAISIQTIVNEFGGTAPHSLNEYYRGGGLVPNTPTNAAIPTSGTIAIGNFYGAANRAIVNLTIGGNTQNYDVYDNRSPSYVAGNTDLTVTVNPGVVVGSVSTGAYAMLVPSAFNPGDTVTIINNGTIVGTGGVGGRGGNSGAPGTATPGLPGDGGGNALFVNRPTTITNNGTVGGGGGGGGGSGSNTRPVGGAPGRRGGGGGGGGAGFNAGAGGPGGNPAPSTVPGSPGATTTGGAGGVSAAPSAAGPGGGLGASGAAGGSGPASPGGAGGGGGNYIVGSPFVTWPVTGTRLGGVA